MRSLRDLAWEIKKITARIRGTVKLSSEIENSLEKKVLHISDTPDTIYPFIFKVIEELKPDYIIHTGDLADNIKLENKPQKLKEIYKDRIKDFIEVLEGVEDTCIYFIPGNHDAVDIIKKERNRINILKEGSVLRIEEIDIGLAHYLENLPQKARLYLYGHNKKTRPKNGGSIFINGLLSINIILLPSCRVEKIAYPMKTEYDRKYRRLSLP